MKKIAVLALIAVTAIAGFTGCKKVIKNIFNGLDAEIPGLTFTIPGAPVPPGFPVPEDEIGFPPYTQHFNLDSSIRAKTNNSFGADDLSSVKIKKIVFKLTNADSLNNLSNFKSARFSLSSNTNSTPAPIASFTFPDVYDSTYTYTAPVDAPELITYLRGSELTYNVYGKLRRYTSKPLKMSVVVTITAR